MAPAFVQTPAPATAPTLTVQADDSSRSVTLVVEGALDLASADYLAETLRELRQRGRQHIRLDLSDLTFIDATALGVIVATHDGLLATGGALTLTGVGRPVSRLLQVTGLDEVLLAPRAAS
jgi:anti-sigma B factor antagonist